MAFIALENVSLAFRVRRYNRIPLTEYLVRRVFRSLSDPVAEVRSVDDVTLRIADGERVGIVGRNGAGKSTLLRVLAGIYPPTTGQRTFEGTIRSVFDLALGFEPQATGRENILYRGYLQGETPRSMRPRIESIIAFSELGDHIDAPVRFYSTGMRLRLGFAIATSTEPEILLLDECLGAGDLAFRRKAQQRMRQTVDKARVLAVVSHDLETVRELCNRVIWMDYGRIRQDGPPKDVIAAYRASSAGLASAATAPRRAVA